MGGGLVAVGRGLGVLVAVGKGVAVAVGVAVGWVVAVAVGEDKGAITAALFELPGWLCRFCIMYTPPPVSASTTTISAIASTG